MKVIWLGIIILVFVGPPLQAQVVVEPLSVQVSKLPADIFGHAVHPFSSKDRPAFFLANVAPNSGTRLFLLLTLPAGKVVPISSKAAPADSLPKGLEVKSLTDSTGQDLLKPDPNADKRKEFFPDNKPITVQPSKDSSKLLIVINGPQAPRKGATSISGELALPLASGLKSGRSAPFTIGSSGHAVVNGHTMFTFKPGQLTSPPRPFEGGRGLPASDPFNYPHSRTNSHPKTSSDSLVAIEISDISPDVVGIELQDTSGKTQFTVNMPVNGATNQGWIPTGTTGVWVVDYVENSRAVTNEKVTFTVDLGVQN